ncbi:hypothetical protein BST27_14725 [Mycobacterium intermedium]|uniref:DUF4226 domain-containing protein n=1 Tax=Mycobacterium intermedium TaxID=28445 RepID=A0A1E3S4C9_MYCIE|nr:DUF4226 domain-containing protein [Mycobacterium intermedium]MCV6967580.1 DUF4226 domain-containing protein [Mycobacterium intermedium]ODQ96979.1 hypothetical protein BHQ20_27985 [Mycobacterium intermedium]OPE52765.1 hypothetical protein BV508_00560 [Mycobacterium intermedium]ORB04124.1 hypothetical protein BST27_14725 [Mycobacterium intermedium]
MSIYDDVVAAIKEVQDATGDPHAWEIGLTPSEVLAVVTPITPPEQLVVILGKIRQAHPHQDGDAAAAIADAEAALAHQNSATSQLDLQVVSAILNAHLKTAAGREALNKLQRDIEAAVRTRSDLDTPAGARDFQRFLIGKLRDIRGIVADASLDDTSKSALMAAWTSLYNASKHEPGAPSDLEPTATAPADEPVAAPVRAAPSAPSPDAGSDPLLDSLLLGDPGPLGGDAPIPSAATPASTATAPALPSMPSLGGTIPPSGGLSSGSIPGSSGGLLGGLDGHRDAHTKDLDHKFSNDSEDTEDRHHDAKDNKDEQNAGEPDPEPVPTGPTTVTLPNGETVTAASPQLAAAIKAAAGGMPIADAFQQQGIAIPPPGTPVTDPIEPASVAPGDIGIFTDRHALGLGRSKALLDGQIQHISAITGPSFLGWVHPPAPATATAPAQTEIPTPTRPAASPSAI